MLDEYTRVMMISQIRSMIPYVFNALVYVGTVLLTYSLTKYYTNKAWRNDPEKLESAQKILVASWDREITQLVEANTKETADNRALRANIKAALAMQMKAAEILGGVTGTERKGK